MAIIKLATRIHAPAEVCFNLSRSIDLHVSSMQSYREQAVAGVTGGLIGLHETVTWKARHLSLNWKMKVQLTELNFPLFFADQMVTGPFRLMRHCHTFKAEGTTTLMTDEFVFRAPGGWLGKCVDELILKPYLRRLLLRRNKAIQEMAEAGVSETYLYDK